MYESVFELVDRFASALSRSDELAQPVELIVQQLTARVARLGRIARRFEANSSNDTLEFLQGVRAELKATEAELLHWQVVLARLTGGEVPIDPDPVPKGEWVTETPHQVDE
ncbi:hypothetical protein HYG77_17160 [Rhodococcus sp. ZPP]|uniref:hypothetical protein n=1 Tax=Rhodococcus sp. ZPP TaxID=2749906 RepID=UPI001AD86F39|nr:hypothetical protein [Rhodococcus sp. ZPP]QTJ67143.1 hypothetical protein HYG77_17160 [Rhodococcus sp. ZPP]